MHIDIYVFGESKFIARDSKTVQTLYEHLFVIFHVKHKIKARDPDLYCCHLRLSRVKESSVKVKVACLLHHLQGGCETSQ